MKMIKLKFDKKDSGLAGGDYGAEIFNSQVKNEIDHNEEVTIEFPENIRIVASSFIQGFFSELIESEGFDYIMEHFTLVTGSKELDKKLIERIR